MNGNQGIRLGMGILRERMMRNGIRVFDDWTGGGGDRMTLDVSSVAPPTTISHITGFIHTQIGPHIPLQ